MRDDFTLDEDSRDDEFYHAGTRGGLGTSRDHQASAAQGGSQRSAVSTGDYLAGTYEPYARYSSASLEKLLNRVINSERLRPLIILDLGVGTGVPGKIVSRVCPGAQLIGVDTSREMLRGAADCYVYGHRLLQADAATLPIRHATADLIYSVSAFHLFGDKLTSLTEMRRVARADGKILIIDVTPEDLAMQLFHRYFPSFHAIESARHVDASQLAHMAAAIGLHLTKTVREPFSVLFPTIEHFLSFVSTRPFFGMREVPITTFEDEVRNCVRQLRGVVGPIVSRSALTAFVLEGDYR